MTQVEDQAFVTLATNDTYCLGALVLAHSLRKVATSRKLVVLITSGVTTHMRSLLASVFDLIQEVNVMDSKDEENLALLTRPELGITFTKLNCWRLTQFTKCVFLDADTLVLHNCDELFDKKELSATADVGWPDCFNSGVFVFHPSNETYKDLVKFAVEQGSFDGGDQGLLNMFFRDWSTKDISFHLSFIYNMNSNASYTYLPAYKQFGKDVKIVHFLGSMKPWQYSYNPSTGDVQFGSECQHVKEHLQYWWHLFIQFVHPHLQPECTGLAGQLSKMSVSSDQQEEGAASPYELALGGSHARQFAWERGQIDYLGTDSFENIKQKLDNAINGSQN
ncbi:glycogenin-1-like [Limulus polyphemus]|uniref:glycogenin glucosyltransferase n=1 Tax=Limulus polyphemus TaxID=6850 RepID=A0ABM1BM24_LIMPO|nr:glycogenin-1-like [Limulus polyphemus]